MREARAYLVAARGTGGANTRLALCLIVAFALIGALALPSTTPAASGHQGKQRHPLRRCKVYRVMVRRHGMLVRVTRRTCVHMGSKKCKVHWKKRNRDHRLTYIAKVHCPKEAAPSPEAQPGRSALWEQL